LIVTGDGGSGGTAPNIGQNLQIQAFLSIGQTAPAGGIDVTMTASSNILISPSGSAAGTQVATIHVNAGSSSTIFYIQAVGPLGAGSYTASASGYSNVTGNVVVTPSGIVISSPLADPGFFGADQYFTHPSSGPATFTVWTAQLDSSNNYIQKQDLAGGQAPLSIALASSNMTVGTIDASVTINAGAGAGSAPATFTPAALGSTVISITQPPTYKTPTAYKTVTVTVN
jgi:hypothetical protein